MKKIILLLYVLVSTLFVFFSYGFVDPHLVLADVDWYRGFHEVLAVLVFDHRVLTGIIFFIFVCIFFGLYGFMLQNSKRLSARWVMGVIVLTTVLLTFSYSAVSYDIFNYITTAKMLFSHKENPYTLMPIEIPNEPNLAFTRAANKYALYGPTWLLLTFIPHVFGFGNIWITMIAFKCFVVGWIWLLTYMLWRQTASVRSIIFFALNPLVLIEVAVSGHNDVVMMTLFFLALSNIGKINSWLALIASIAVKGVTAALIPFVRKPFNFTLGYWMMLSIFFVFAPIREELYPWYAVWFIPFAAVLYAKKSTIESDIAVVLSFGLELRHIPYMIMGYYEGPGPLIRALLTGVPMVAYVMWRIWQNKIKSLSQR